MAEPDDAAAIFHPLARLACTVGGADIEAHPWVGVDEDLEDVTRLSLRGGHIQVRAGTRRGGAVRPAV